MVVVSRLWEDAAGVLETAFKGPVGPESDLAILVDGQNCLRIVYGSEWNIDALQREYGASTAYTVRRSAASVTVEAQSGAERCTMRRSTGIHPLAILGSAVPHHLIATAR